MQATCVSCGIELYALNMGFTDDEFCQECEEIMIEKLSRDIDELNYSHKINNDNEVT